MRSADTWEPSAVSSRRGDTLTGRRIRADWPLTRFKCHFIAFWQRESKPAHTQKSAHSSHMHRQTAWKPAHPPPKHQISTSSYPILWHSCLQECLSKSHKPLLAQAIHLRLSANADSRPIRYGNIRTCEEDTYSRYGQFWKWKDKKKHAKWCSSFVLYLLVLILSARSHCMFLHPHEETCSCCFFHLFPFILHLFPSIFVSPWTQSFRFYSSSSHSAVKLIFFVGGCAWGHVPLSFLKNAVWHFAKRARLIGSRCFAKHKAYRKTLNGCHIAALRVYGEGVGGVSPNTGLYPAKRCQHTYAW